MVGALDRSLAGAEGALEVVVAGGEVVLVAGDFSPEILLIWEKLLLLAASSFLLFHCSNLAESP